DLNLDGVRTFGQVDGPTNVVQAVGGGHGVVLIGLENVAVLPALESTGCRPRFSVDGDAGVGAEGLKVYPVVACAGHAQRALPGQGRIGRQCIAALDREIKLSIGLSYGARRVHSREAGLPVVAKGAGRHGGASHVVLYGETNLRVAGDLPRRIERADLPLGQADGTLPTDADGHHLARAGADQHYLVEVGGLQRQGSPLVFEEHSGVFAGLLDDLGVRVDRLRGNLVLR